MADNKIKDGFLGELQINIPRVVIEKKIKKTPFLNSLYITHIGYFPKARYHYRERIKGCEDNILIYCLGVKGHYETENGKFVLTANHFTILPPNQFHRIQADLNDPWTIYWVHFTGKQLNELNTWAKAIKLVAPTPVKYNETILDTWKEMYYSLQNNYSAENIGYANLCLSRFLSFFFYPDKKNVQSAIKDPLGKSILYMKSNIGKQLTVEEIASRFNYSASHYSALFKQKTGQSPMEHFIQLKMHYACQLLTQGDKKIKNIAEEIGYSDPYYFSRIFKNTMGQSPLQFREKGLQ